MTSGGHLPVQDRYGDTKVDRVVAAAFVVVSLGELWFVDRSTRVALGPALVVSLLLVLAAATLLLRRRWPWLALASNSAVVAALVAIGHLSDTYGWTNLIVVSSVALAVGAVRSAPALVVGLLLVGMYFIRFADDHSGATGVFAALLWCIAWLVGLLQRGRAAEAEQRAMVDAQRTQLRLEADRSRVARELHDVVGHSLNVMVVHAGVGRQASPADLAIVDGALETIESTGREALEELDRVLGLLRNPDDGSGPPASGDGPGLADLSELVAGVRQAGLHTTLVVPDDPPTLKPAVGLSVYRIVQEALTNVLKHADAATVEVLVSARAGWVDVEVVDDGRGLTAGAPPGRGTGGMEERALMHGGTWSLDTGPAGGARVRASIPIGGSST